MNKKIIIVQFYDENNKLKHIYFKCYSWKTKSYGVVHECMADIKGKSDVSVRIDFAEKLKEKVKFETVINKWFETYLGISSSGLKKVK